MVEFTATAELLRNPSDPANSYGSYGSYRVLQVATTVVYIYGTHIPLRIGSLSNTINSISLHSIWYDPAHCCNLKFNKNCRTTGRTHYTCTTGYELRSSGAGRETASCQRSGRSYRTRILEHGLGIEVLVKRLLAAKRMVALVALVY